MTEYGIYEAARLEDGSILHSRVTVAPTDYESCVGLLGHLNDKTSGSTYYIDHFHNPGQRSKEQ